MEGRTSTERRVWPGKTISPRLTRQKAWAYKKIKISQLFRIVKGKRLTKANAIAGDINFIGSSAANHGITMKVGNSNALHPANTITVSYNGSVGQAFYQTEPYWASDDINVLYPTFSMNEPIALYLCAAIRKAGAKYAYSYKWAKEIMENDFICLPIKKNEAVDFAFMESRIREMEKSRICEMEAYLKVAGFEDCKLTSEESMAIAKMSYGKVKFKSFWVVDDKLQGRENGVFKVNNSHNILQSSIVAGSGNIPYVTAGEGNNSVYSYISYDMKQIEKGNAIMIGGKTMVVTYQSEDFFSNDSHNLVLYAKDDNLKKELVQLYMVASLNKSLKPKYSWGDSISKAKIKKDEFLLPVTETGEIDYHFMALYIRAQEKIAIQKVKDWRAKEIATTKTLVIEENSMTIKPQRSYEEWENENDAPMMVAEDIIIPGSLEVRLRNTKKEELLGGDLDLVLMYAISPVARKKTESAGKIALGIKEEQLVQETVKALESVRYIMFHYWKNCEARPFKLTAPTRIVNKQDIPDGFLVRQEKDAKQYLLIEYNPSAPAELGEYDVLKTQRKGSNRYIPFVCKVENLK